MTPTDRDRYAAIVEWLKPGSLSCVKTCRWCSGDGFLGKDDPMSECATCSGHGDVFREWKTCPTCRGKKWISPVGGTAGSDDTCPTCNGEGRVPDEEGRRLIEAAVAKWTMGNQFPDPVWPVGLWDNRHNQHQPWQSAIEQHVREYRAVPPDFGTVEGLERLKGMLREAGHWWRVTWRPRQRQFFAIVDDTSNDSDGSSIGDTEAAALIAAVEEAMPTPRTP